eukprot:76103_1
MKRRADNDLQSPPKKRRKTDDNDDDDEDIQQTLQNSKITLCKFNCGRSVAPGATRNNNPYDTCCRECAVSKGTAAAHDYRCDTRNVQISNNGDNDENDVDIAINDNKNDDDNEIAELYDNSHDNKENDNNTAKISILPIELLQKIISNLNIIDLVPFSISSKNNQILFSKLSVPQSIIDNELNKKKPNYKQLIGILKSRRICVNNNN